MRFILIILVFIGGVSFAQVIDKVGDRYVVGIYMTDVSEQGAIIEKANKEIANAEAYCQRQFIAPQQETIAKAQSRISEMSAMDVKKADAEFKPDLTSVANWSDITVMK